MSTRRRNLEALPGGSDWAQKNEDSPGRGNILSKNIAVGNHQTHKDGEIHGGKTREVRMGKDVAGSSGDLLGDTCKGRIPAGASQPFWFLAASGKSSGSILRAPRGWGEPSDSGLLCC